MTMFLKERLEQEHRDVDRRKASDDLLLAASVGLDSSVWELKVRHCGFREGDFELLETLSHSTPQRNVFFEPPFFTASHERLGMPVKKLVTLSEKLGADTTMKLVFPVQPESVGFPGVQVMRVWSHLYGPLSSPLLLGEEAEAVAEKLIHCAAEVNAPGWNAVVFQDLPMGGHFARSVRKLSGLEGRWQFVEPYQRAWLLPMDPGSYPGSVLSAKRRKELKRQYRRLGELGDLQVEIVTDLMGTLLRFEEFLLMETRSWKGERGTSLHMIKKTAAFARQAITNLVAADACRIYSLRLNDRAVSSVIVLRSGGQYFPWKMAYDANYGKFSVGKLLIMEMSRDLLNQPGFEGADSLAAPDNAMINQLWPQRLDMGTLVIGFGARGPQTVEKIVRGIVRHRRLKKIGKHLLGR